MWLRCALVVSGLSLMSVMSTARADIAPQPRPKEHFMTHFLEVKGLPAGMVLVVADEGESVASVRTIDADGTHQLARGGSRQGAGMSSPKLWAMSAEQHAAWKAGAAKVVAEQERACRDENKGCPHISRFTPSYPAPAPRVDCQTSLKLHLSGPRTGPDTWTDVVEVVQMSGDACTLKLSSPAPMQCSTGLMASSAASLVLGMGLVVASRRRREPES